MTGQTDREREEARALEALATRPIPEPQQGPRGVEEEASKAPGDARRQPRAEARPEPGQGEHPPEACGEQPRRQAQRRIQLGDHHHLAARRAQLTGNQRVISKARTRGQGRGAVRPVAGGEPDPMSGSGLQPGPLLLAEPRRTGRDHRGVVPVAEPEGRQILQDRGQGARVEQRVGAAAGDQTEAQVGVAAGQPVQQDHAVVRL